jgi:hypothetical protein
MFREMKKEKVAEKQAYSGARVKGFKSRNYK